MTTGVVAHLFWRGKIFLILRDQGEGFADPGCWDSLTETAEPEDNDDLEYTMRRGFIEEIGFVPEKYQFLGVTRAGHGFFFGVLSDHERASIKLGEGQAFDFFGLWEVDRGRVKLGGAVRHHAEAYPQAFANMACGVAPSPEELRLRVPVLSNK